ncbi:MAG TPA: peroxiredoxin [Burkholderiales bacterium]|nr:peroxiredoxin [Burkholderiales bacterium]
MLEPGVAAPEFELPDADMEIVSLERLRGKRNLVLYFYPKDDTPGCTIEAIAFSELEEEFGRLNTLVLGVSMDDCMSHGSFRDKHGLTVRLLADTEGEVARKYGVLQEKELNGARKYCIRRSTFVIDGNGVIRHALYGVSPRGHAQEVLKLVKQMR